ncbi:MAG: 50S ribosomal protein L25/general stress protein Ctc [Pseudomonadota bacterium]
MSEAQVLKAERRERVGKGAARALRREHKIPAVIYGDKKPPVAIAISYKETHQRIHAGGFMTNILEIDVGDEKFRVLPKDYQLDPVRDFPMHVDFLRISKNASVTLDIPVQFLNEEICPGLKAGGVLNVVRYTVEVDCPADKIPDSIVVDLDGFNLGDSVHISDVTLDEGVVPTITDRDFTIATIAAPAGLKSDEDEAEEVEAEEGAEEAPEEEQSEE